MRRCVVGNSSGLPVPRRRTFATALQAFAHSMPASLSASMPALAANAGSRGMGSSARVHQGHRPPLTDSSAIRGGAHQAYVYHRLGGGKSLLTGEDTPNARRAFADPRASLSWIAASSLPLTWVRSSPSRIFSVAHGGDSVSNHS